MGGINLYKIKNDRIDKFLKEISKKLPKVKHKRCKAKSFWRLSIYYSCDKRPKNLKWQWVLSAFGENKLHTEEFPKAILVIKDEKGNVYAVTFGSTYFLVDKYCDRNFAFNYARKLEFDGIKTTTFTTPNSRRNKTVNTYINYDKLEFDSGEAYAKLKARIKESSRCDLFKPTCEFGTSLCIVPMEYTLRFVIDIIKHIENFIITQSDKCKIPVFSPVKDKQRITKLDDCLCDEVEKNTNVSISELDIVGTIEVFNKNDEKFTLKYCRTTKDITTLTLDEVRKFGEENALDFRNSMLDISVIVYQDGVPVVTKKIKDMIDYTNDTERCFLCKGIWYQYNDDYLDYLKASMDDIDTEYHEEYDFSSDDYDKFIVKRYTKERKSEKYVGMSKSDIITALKKTYYFERAFNMKMEEDYGFKNYDRVTNHYGLHSIEIMDLYKNKTMFAVKVGNTSSKLCFAIDQSLETLRLYKNKSVNDLPDIDTVVIWLILTSHKKIHKAKKKVDLNKLNMLMLKNGLDNWKKEVRLQGLKPIVYINYKNKRG